MGLVLAILAGGCGGPTAPEAPSPGVAVLPASAEIPENLLRFYVRFPAPMRRGDATTEIALLDEDGERVEGAFLEIGQELWSADMRTLTLVLDPGRIKEGVAPNRVVGPPLRAGERRALRVGAGMRAGDGAPLGEELRVSFAVVAPDREGPNPAAWRLSVPRWGTQTALVVAPDAPIDPVMAPRYLRVEDAGGAPLPGTWVVADAGDALRFTPVEPWPAEPLWLAVHPGLEDPAGNRVDTRFDMAPGTVAGLSREEPVRVSLRP